jgi:hypothetical protein
MAVYPLDFYRRAEAKWKQRAGTLRTEGGLPKKHGDSAPVRWPWLLAIGHTLRSEYAASEQPLPKRLVALLKELTKRRH